MPTIALRCLPCVLLFVVPLPAQGADTVRASFGVSKAAGELRAGGPDYSARFDGRGVEFVPLLDGGAAPASLRFRLDAVRRGASTVWTHDGDATLPQVDGARVAYGHADGPAEVYEARVDGIEQSFVFAERPAGRGDLVVRGTITTELPLVAASDAGVCYERDGLGGVMFGAVTGVDANGATVRGAIRVDGDHVEWVLPAAFVDGAAYPLTLDPLIGSAFQIGNVATGVDLRPSIAFDATSGRYLVVWNVTVAAGDPEMRGQFVSTTGTLVGSQLFLGYGTLTRQAVANIDGSNRFVVVFSTKSTIGFTSSNVQALAVTVSPPSLSNAVLVDSQVTLSASIGHAIVGGDSRPVSTAQTALVVFAGLSGELMTRIVHVPPTGDPIVTGASATNLGLDGGWTASITAHGGPSLRWMVAWQHTSGVPAVHSIGGGVIGSSATWCAAPVVVHPGTFGDDFADPVSASADGANFLVAWIHSAPSVPTELEARLVTISGACGSALLGLGPVATVSDAPVTKSTPAVAFAKDKYVIAWRDRFGGVSPDRVMVKSLDPTTCLACGAVWSVETTGLDQQEPAIASRYSTGDTASDEALVVWSNGTVRGRRFESSGTGTVTNMGGNCGLPAPNNVNTYTGAPVIGSNDFELRLQSPTAPVLALVIGLSNVSIPCGPCTLVPAFDATVGGSTSVPLPLPCDVSWLGLDFYTQWLLFAPGGCPLFPDYALSNALKFTVGE